MQIVFYFCLNIIISIIIIFIGHQIWNYIKNTYSTKKTKDLVNTQITKYKKMMKEIQENDNSKHFLNSNEKELMDKNLTEFIQNI
jgi:predicted PurR-regulated permease PerM